MLKRVRLKYIVNIWIRYINVESWDFFYFFMCLNYNCVICIENIMVEEINIYLM